MLLTILTGYAATPMASTSLFDQTPPLEQRQYTWRQIIRRLTPLLRPHQRRIVVAATLVSAVGLAVSVAPLFSAYIIDVAIIRERSIPLAAAAAAAFVASQLLRVGCWWLAQKSVIAFCQRLLFDLRSLGFRHLQTCACASTTTTPPASCTNASSAAP
jgi:ABC-type multidrug transport system fused ATPase/permease subunit